MNKEFINILLTIIEELQIRKDLDEVIDIFNNSKEFDEKQVYAAFSILFEKMIQLKAEGLLNPPIGNRFLDETELNHIGTEKYNYLLKLMNLGIINSIDFENIINEMMFIPEVEIDKNEFKILVLASIANTNQNSDLGQFPNSQSTLFISDKIN